MPTDPVVLFLAILLWGVSRLTGDPVDVKSQKPCPEFLGKEIATDSSVGGEPGEGT